MIVLNKMETRKEICFTVMKNIKTTALTITIPLRVSTFILIS